MNRRPLLFGASQACRSSLVLPLLALIVLSPSAIADQSIRIAMQDGIVSGTLPETDQTFAIEIADAEVYTLNTHTDRIWVYGKQRLQAYDPDGGQLIDQHHPELPIDHDAADLSVGYNSVWLVIGRNLYQFDEQGKLVKKRAFRTMISAVHFDIKQAQILVTTPSYVFILDSEGRTIKRIRTHLPNIA